MLPRWHIFYGILFTLLIWIVSPEISLIYLFLILLSSILIDFDHYMCSFMKTGKLHLKHAFDYHEEMKKRHLKERKKGIRKKGDFHIFHTIEFHVLIGIIGIFWTPFFYIFIGMVFHSMLDLFYMIKKDYLYRREYFFFNWLRDKF